MAVLFAIVAAVFWKHIESSGIDSSETSRIENSIYGPFYDTLLFNDIAEILSELDGNEHSPLDALINSESESDENVEDLLSEYQHFLEKAHKQRKYYLEKTKTKNKVPLYRHDTYVKNKPGASPAKYDDYLPNKMYHSGFIKSPRSYYNSPLELFIPKNYYSNFEMTSNQNENQKLFTPEQSQSQQLLPLFDQSDRSNHDPENGLNIRIKVEIQAPKSLGSPGSHHCKNHTHSRAWDNTDNVDSAPSTLSLPYPYYNVPMAMPMMKVPKMNKPEGAQYHKIMIHKKKKSRPSNTNKKHRKKLISFHDVKLDTRPQTPTFFVESFAASSFNNFNSTNVTEDKINISTQNSGKPNLITIESNKTLRTTTAPAKTTEIIFETNKTMHTTMEPAKTTKIHYIPQHIIIPGYIRGENTKNENSIELSGVTEKSKNSRKRRDILLNGNSSIATSGTEKPKPKLEDIKKVERFSFTDPELLYWPNINIPSNQTVRKKNITILILEREHKKAKLNISKESIRLNHKTALEKAIFGEVNWDDIDTVAPVFMSFVGKYIRGVLTFCSPTICHSMKCAQKECIHRICAPSERSNNNGHCVGSNSTDSVASMESIMDLPSNVVFEIVDILQDNMPGKMFGKVTLCISPKCITFASAKKSFLKNKCSIKDLNSSGHCQSVKNIKNLQQ